jgi:hypothetical protein
VESETSRDVVQQTQRNALLAPRSFRREPALLACWRRMHSLSLGCICKAVSAAKSNTMYPTGTIWDWTSTIVEDGVGFTSRNWFRRTSPHVGIFWGPVFGCMSEMIESGQSSM